MYRIMVVEDDRGIVEGIKKQASAWGYEVEAVHDFREVVSEFAKMQPHLVLIDIGLPFYDGYHWCAEIRKLSKVPIIFISSASDNMNIVMAVNMGADDFIAKPFEGTVLIAKIQALLRRSYDFTSSAPVIEHKGAVLNLGDWTFSYEGQKITLTKNEFRVMTTLLQNKGKVVSREKMMEILWETDCFVDENTLSVNVGRLRKKLDKIGLEGFISTRFGVGYLVE